MKKILALVLACMPTLALANQWFRTNKPVQCGPFQDLVDIVTGKEFQEQLTWMGNSDEDKTKIVLFRNSNTNTWTVIQYNREIACILGMGRGDNTFENISDRFKM